MHYLARFGAKIFDDYFTETEQPEPPQLPLYRHVGAQALLQNADKHPPLFEAIMEGLNQSPVALLALLTDLFHSEMEATITFLLDPPHRLEVIINFLVQHTKIISYV